MLGIERTSAAGAAASMAAGYAPIALGMLGKGVMHARRKAAGQFSVGGKGAQHVIGFLTGAIPLTNAQTNIEPPQAIDQSAAEEEADRTGIAAPEITPSRKFQLAGSGFSTTAGRSLFDPAGHHPLQTGILQASGQDVGEGVRFVPAVVIRKTYPVAPGSRDSGIASGGEVGRLQLPGADIQAESACPLDVWSQPPVDILIDDDDLEILTGLGRQAIEQPIQLSGTADRGENE